MQNGFYKMPKRIFEQKMSSDTKILYTLMLDREQISKKNGWLDKNNQVYIIFTIENICKLLGCGASKANKLLKEMEYLKLIIRKKQGQGKPSIIYLLGDYDNSKIVKSNKQECQKTHSNNTNNINKEYNKNNLSHEIDGLDHEELDYYIYEKLEQEKTMPYEFLENYKLTLACINQISDVNLIKDKQEKSIYQCFNTAITQMLTEKNIMQINKEMVTNINIYEKFCENLKYTNEFTFSIYQLQQNSILNFKKSLKTKHINNYISYMKSCIWTIMKTGTTGINSIENRFYV